MKVKSTFITVLLLVSLCLNAQQSGIHPESKPHIDVTGTAEMEVVPDEIFVTICIKERFEGRDKLTIESQEEKFKSALKELSIPLENFSLSDANADYIRVKLGKKDVVAKKDYLLKLSDATQLGKVFEQLDKLNLNEAYISKLSHTKIEQFRKEIRAKAVEVAEDKAKYLLIAIHQQLGKPLIIEEVPAYDEYNTNNYNRSGYTSNFSYGKFSPSDESEGETSFRKLKLKASVFARFEIKQ
jgi:uncharacterized protein